MRKENTIVYPLLTFVVILLTFLINPIMASENDLTQQPLTISESAVEALKSYPSTFDDPSLKVSSLYSIDSSSLPSHESTVSEFRELDRTPLGDLSDTVGTSVAIKGCNPCVREEDICDFEIRGCEVEGMCEEWSNDCCCCCEEPEALTGLAAVGMGGGGGGFSGGFGGGFGGGGGGGSGGGDGGGDGDGGGNGNGVVIPEPSTFLILGTMVTASAILKWKKKR